MAALGATRIHRSRLQPFEDHPESGAVQEADARYVQRDRAGDGRQGFPQRVEAREVQLALQAEMARPDVVDLKTHSARAFPR